MSSPFVIVKTADLRWRHGLPYSGDFEDVYFSGPNGYNEKKHVFIDGNKLNERWSLLQKDRAETFVIAETGFGTGLNFLVTWESWLRSAPCDARLFYYSCEKFPLKKKDLMQCLALWPQLNKQAGKLLEHYPVLTPGFHYLKFEHGRVNLILMLGDAEQCLQQLLICGDKDLEFRLRHKFVDAWFLDGFSPTKNEALWSGRLLQIIGLLSRSGTTLATYSASSLVKNGLRSASFAVKKTVGYGQKRHMVIAECQGVETDLPKRSTPWHVAVGKKVLEKHAMIIGSGLAGCFLANALAERGWRITLLEAEPAMAMGASGNEYAILYPKLSAYRSPLTDFMLSAYLYACRYYRNRVGVLFDGELHGLLQLAYDEKEALSQESMRKWLQAYPDLGRLVSSEQASQLSGVAVKDGGLYIPMSGWINCRQLCAALIQHSGIDLITNTHVERIVYDGELWQAGSFRADVVILANGYQANSFEQTTYCPLKPIGGQTTSLQSTDVSRMLQMPLCGDGHISVAVDGHHSAGATYHLGSTQAICTPQDDLINLNKIKPLSQQLQFSEESVCGNWTAIRAATPDYLPLAGPVVDKDVFMRQFASLASNAKRYIPSPAMAYPGLYICAGFGSRGLTTIPLATEWLASQIHGDPVFLPSAMIQSLTPSRFLLRTIVRSRNYHAKTDQE
ncbi:bifunctional tRNA (5-methylaminomethyl-2-thiouridine)(34)-methyltransferase MnmD/FAD-dependent 5-carboxymethylaminomethyl-2-thiouridine(34) oxidoreductase MnmC [Legionella spiritensis]|uniref:tRNA 5-methylaminomethyl-2-thiouridine biosynthesis bifunctional protein MnmC n=1 Tax=Legionella spiritensis TaxID=452 RepID=A0A0W0YY37_LEGSP|nr:bifunctional tRNA (5-methylaminomethyl-2-thiouridine)(34)-methyltransferase MnmD/FAD-dependent 5-carboxymethylaminomethyl-2-thiouridine(34) oxidoreductase MnmC [Legionella spiritensis]KTD61796.1 tRNA 5-methylaminomethyl-2-thiouridine biosynthesis bifunctional protein mnmC [Legionella spiritensis]SNV38196.1 putative peptidase [Legionella spiritensis]